MFEDARELFTRLATVHERVLFLEVHGLLLMSRLHAVCDRVALLRPPRSQAQIR